MKKIKKMKSKTFNKLREHLLEEPKFTINEMEEILAACNVKGLK